MSNSETKTKKALSGATMGMRFMQRRMNVSTSKDDGTKVDGTKGTVTPKKNETPQRNGYNGSASKSDHDHYGMDDNWELKKPQEHENDNQSSTDMDVDVQIKDPSADTAAMLKHPLQHRDQQEEQDVHYTSDDQIPLFETATASDMYGIRCELIGRRSFNNFNKAVEETYQSAVHARRKNKLDTKVEKEHISDEELLRRYQQYVKGRGDMSNGGKKVVNNIGNLKEKAKKRKR